MKNKKLLPDLHGGAVFSWPQRLAAGLALLLGALALSAAEDAPAPAAATAPSSSSSAVRGSTQRGLRLPDSPDPYTGLDLPAHFKTAEARQLDNTPASNPLTDAGATLGRVLFYDTRLSANDTVACGSCHLQSHAFTVPQAFGVGFSGKVGDRNPISLVELRYYPRGRFFWDERARTLEDQTLMPIQSPSEMGQDLKKVAELLRQDDQYPELFRKAFGDTLITYDRISKAMAQFIRSMVSYQSRYDQGMANAASVRQDFVNFTPQENRGKSLFMQDCATCHLPQGQAAHFLATRPLNNGLDANFKTTDGGVGDITLNAAQLGLFKSPSLRNVEYTGPYMHDGRLATLEQVINHYNQDVHPHPNLDPRLRRPLNLSPADQGALVAFLKTLSDPIFLKDPKFSNPFSTVTASVGKEPIYEASR